MIGSVSKLVVCLPAIALLVMPGAARAAGCEARPLGVNFGDYDPLQHGAKDGFGTITVKCDKQVSFTIELSAGQGSYADRIMTNGETKLRYNIYIDTQHRSIWGDGSGSSGTVSISAPKAQVRIYGSIRAGQAPAVGNYVDAIVVTLVY